MQKAVQNVHQVVSSFINMIVLLHAHLEQDLQVKDSSIVFHAHRTVETVQLSSNITLPLMMKLK